jgi:cobalt/nickel transport system permease protein
MPLYFMYPIKVAVATMMSEHLIIAGPVEAIATAIGLHFIANNYPDLLRQPRAA